MVSQYHFLAYLYRLRYIKRWSLMRNMVSENVAEHSYHVALLTHVLCTIGNEIYGRHYDTDRAVSMALFHDATEVFTGDIPTPVKHQNKDILSNFREIEHTAAHKLLDMVPEELASVYKQMVGIPLANGEDDANAHRLRTIIKAADQLDAFIKCTMELSAGNREFAVAKNQIGEALQRMELQEVDYFLTHFAPSLEKTLDELSD
ncbi:5'-deoxynucleotidase [Paenibacillus senegalensis]|uniref:5'-deoxynucleotidase n=1 Tax=Paenibacillus senegalensis TaxID=1465766 RepID=UPI000287AEB7|nr:5'-deoxynucleotidase [Paenibacillus senegalensis]